MPFLNQSNFCFGYVNQLTSVSDYLFDVAYNFNKFH